ncbi:SUF system Fe-S cluster assembly regulator [Sphingopyxis sp. H050]|uniref:SUF system Fe-S cluster assembly regulator n=1 Tax=Sphingopyxis sp. H050 TaxID=1759072 RepID=UPI000A4D6E43|nr:SUF system Fe-S cluster assembly regulator [Sphingopyxis sp. H050]
MRLSNLADYAVVLMSAAARQCGSHYGAGPIHAAMLAEQTGIPGPTAQKLVSGLARAGLLVASRGSGGGVRLARPAAAISVADIIEAVEGPIALTSCVSEGRHDCSLEGSCKVQPHWGVVNGAVRGALAEISLASLTVAPAKSNPFVSSEVETPIDSARTKGLSNPERVEGLEANGIPL